MKIKDEYVLQDLPGMAVVVPQGDEKYFLKLNSTAAFIWRAFESENDPDSVARALAAKYSISYERALRSVRKTVDEWLGSGFIE